MAVGAKHGSSHKIGLFSELLGLRPRLNTDQVHAGLGLTSSVVSFTAQRYIDSLLLVADRIKESCVAARVSCETEKGMNL